MLAFIRPLCRQNDRFSDSASVTFSLWELAISFWCDQMLQPSREDDYGVGLQHGVLMRTHGNMVRAASGGPDMT